MPVKDFLYSYVVRKLIEINILYYGAKNMTIQN